MKKAFVGIDIGKNGGVAIVNEQGDLVFVATIPKIGKEVDLNKLNDLIKHFKNFGATQHIILERVHSIFGSGAASNWTFGQVSGFIEAFVVAHELKYTKMMPAAWQKISWEGINIPIVVVPKFKTNKETNKKEQNGTRDKVLTKEASLLAAKRLFPTFKFEMIGRNKDKIHDGIVDASLLAYAGYVKFK